MGWRCVEEVMDHIHDVDTWTGGYQLSKEDSGVSDECDEKSKSSRPVLCQVVQRIE